MSILESPRLLLVPLADEHLPGLHAINSDAAVMTYIGDGAPLTLRQSQQMIDTVRQHWAERGMSWWALLDKDGGDMVGAAALQPLDERSTNPPEIGWRLRRSSWGRGYATEAAGAIVDYARRLGQRRLVAIAHPANLASLAVMHRLGMLYLGLEAHDISPCAIFELFL
jgi:RimJ/RimL family protein N-acetyltransferase